MDLPECHIYLARRDFRRWKSVCSDNRRSFLRGQTIEKAIENNLFQ